MITVKFSHFETNTPRLIDGSPHSNTARFINHSCVPNAESFVSGKRVWVWSRKNIEAVKEITMDDGPVYFDEYTFRCCTAKPGKRTT